MSYVRCPAMLQGMGSRSRSLTLVMLRVRSDWAADPTSQDGHRPPVRTRNPRVAHQAARMRTRRTVTAGLATATLLALTACASTEDTGTSAPSTPAATTSSVSAADLAKAREAAGLPPSPKPVDRAAYIDGLNAINPDIVHGKDDKAISRGINACSSIKNLPGETAKQIGMTSRRFTSPTHPEGRDTATAEKILALAHKHICPDF